ncbi:MAG: beta-N-acetylhexosaminidase, partial [Lachnospiraceae bacterium]|nr:beta-N-acetylhexosaminidase [Lachnospiraceae bacterium]
MIDCSRNGVMTAEKVREFADLMAGMGYNMLMLYTEDTYEIDGEPFFGYMRGRYSKAELKELDAYCASKGIELIPCIQTLAHLNSLRRWPVYEPMFDINDVLLAGDERVYRLIGKMFDTLAECFTTRRVHIGMDEAHFVGLGRYLNEHGYTNRALLMAEHLKKVNEIAAERGFTTMIWSDMFIRLNNNGAYRGKDLKVPEETVKAVPKGVELVYWDYYSKDPEDYRDQFKAHLKFVNNPIAFAGGIWTWTGYAPSLTYSIDATKAALEAAKDVPMDTIFFTLWGDNGKDCSYFASLPAMFAAAELTKGNEDFPSIERAFEEQTGYTFEEFMALELPNVTSDERSQNENPCKYLLFNDPFIGLYDFTVAPGLSERYKKAEALLRASVNGRKYDYLFDFMSKLCGVLSLKCGLGIRIRTAYKAGDKKALKILADETIPELLARTEALYEAFRTVWLTENKPFGLEVEEARFGFLLLRLRSCRDRLTDYLEGRTADIEELETEQLPIRPE